MAEGDEQTTPTVVVTGAAMGIGRAIATRLIAAGNRVIGVDRDTDAMRATAAELGERVEPLFGDIGEWKTHERAAEAATSSGTLVGWVNNAGIDTSGAAHEVTADQIEAGLRTLLYGPMYGTAVAVRSLLPYRSGSIVNIASIQGIVAFPGYYTYQTAKAGVIMLSKGVAVDYGIFGIRCNAVCPGSIDTPMTRAAAKPDAIPALLEEEGKLAPLGRIGTSDEIAEVVHFLLSQNSSYITGATIVADGGATARCYPYPPLALLQDLTP
jgi:NAD(P)-dependent dehydrogenase (short-subunit alcohol dehydrogenase family)